MKKIYYWIIAIIITILAVIYQRYTGPTYPKKVKVALQNGTVYVFSFARSHPGESDLKIKLNLPDSNFTARLYYKRYPTKDSYTIKNFVRKETKLISELPHQPPAGKLAYYIEIIYSNQSVYLSKNQPVIIRYRGEVPASVIIPHVLLIFVAMLLSNLAGAMAIGAEKKHIFYGKLAFFALPIGGMIFGPIMQKFAFGEFWTGFPKGYDLTDNKTLIAFIFWLIAFSFNRTGKRAYLTIIASIIMLIVFSIPHSMMGSELDYESGKVTTGFINKISLRK